MRFPLRFTIPILLIVFTITLAIWSLKTNGRIAVNRVESDMSSNFNNVLTRLQENVEFGFRKSDLVRIKKEISALGSNDHLKNLSLVNENDKIISGSQFDLIGKKSEYLLPLTETDKIEITKKITLSKAKHHGVIFLSSDRNTLWGIYPIRLGYEKDSLRPTKVGVLIAQIDLIAPKAVALGLVKSQVFQFCVVLSVLVVGLGIFIYFQMTRRIQKLVIATETFAAGEYNAPIDVKGNDEITTLARSMEQTANQLLEDEARLQASATELKRSNFELQEFASIASHDLQEPLRKVITFVDRLKEKTKNLDEVTCDYINRIKKSTMRMQVFIDDLLVYSSVMIQPKQFEQIDLNLIIKESLSNLEDSIARNKGTINVDDLPALQADPAQMMQLLQNLIGNALKYHKVGIPPIINIQGQDSGNGEISIVIEDNGIGFSEKYAERIFHPFQRLHGTSEYEGTGIGLAICRRIIDRHNGTITVKSNLGEGSMFIVTLPKSRQKVSRKHLLDL